MANTKEIQKRMKSIQDTMKITNAMYMISSAKLRTAKQKLEDTEPYFFSLRMAISRFLRHIPENQSRYFEQEESIPKEEKKRGYIVITADKGLAGAYNHNVIKMAHELMKQGENNRLFVVGELGRQYFAREGLQVDTEFKYTVQNPSLHRARVITDRVMELYDEGELDEIYLIYTKMENSFSMEAEKLKLLPLKKEDFMKDPVKNAPIEVYQEQIKAEPSMEVILEHVLPNCVTGIIYSTLVESFASEHNSRMMAMQAATDSAKEMLGMLSVEYNRVRQSAITQQITEVIGGAKAQKNKKTR